MIQIPRLNVDFRSVVRDFRPRSRNAVQAVYDVRPDRFRWWRGGRLVRLPTRRCPRDLENPNSSSALYNDAERVDSLVAHRAAPQRTVGPYVVHGWTAFGSWPKSRTTDRNRRFRRGIWIMAADHCRLGCRLRYLEYRRNAAAGRRPVIDRRCCLRHGVAWTGPRPPTNQRAPHAVAGRRAAKEQLSRHAAADLHVPLVTSTSTSLREEFEKRRARHLDRTIALTLATLRGVGLPYRTDRRGVPRRGPAAIPWPQACYIGRSTCPYGHATSPNWWSPRAACTPAARRPPGRRPARAEPELRSASAGPAPIPFKAARVSATATQARDGHGPDC